jgi:ABC-type multidrug transport system permease subunit
MLKLIAAVIMLIDHIGFVIFPEHIVFRLIGRLAMPIFAYSIALGFTKTRSYKKYLLRMGIFAIISQIPFWIMDYAAQPHNFEWMHFNIGFTFFGALIALYLYKKVKDNPSESYILQIIGIIMIIAIVSLLNCDYGGYGILVVIVFYEYLIVRKDIKKTTTALLLVTLSLPIVYLMNSLQGVIDLVVTQSIAVGALPLIRRYDKVHFKKLKYFFYVFYPGHMLLLALVKIFML